MMGINDSEMKIARLCAGGGRLEVAAYLSRAASASGSRGVKPGTRSQTPAEVMTYSQLKAL